MKNPVTRFFLAALRFVSMCLLTLIILVRTQWPALLVLVFCQMVILKWIEQSFGQPLTGTESFVLAVLLFRVLIR